MTAATGPVSLEESPPLFALSVALFVVLVSAIVGVSVVPSEALSSLGVVGGILEQSPE